MADKLTWYEPEDPSGECSYCGEAIEDGEASEMRRIFKTNEETGRELEGRLHARCYAKARAEA